MQTYYISQSQGLTFRTEDTASGDLFLHLENMYQLDTSSIDLSGSYDFVGYENLLTITASLDGLEGTEYRATITDGDETIWRGTIQIYETASEAKSIYETKRTEYSSSISTNEYIIL